MNRSPIALFTCVAALAGGVAAQTAQPEEQPFKIQDYLGEDHWLKLSGEFRLRYEGLDGQFRAASRLDSAENLVFTRTLLRADAELEGAVVTVELLDGRHYGGGTGSALNTGHVNTVDFLQARAQFQLGELAGGKQRLRVGRQTVDLGSRRLVARNNFRNTINAFTGIEWGWKSDDAEANVFWTMPVRRRPRDLASILDNEVDLDDQDSENQFFGAFYTQKIDDVHTVDAYIFVLDENAAGTRRRELFTPGARLRRKPSKGNVDYEAEGIYQFGDSRRAAGGPDLSHSAWFGHASVGYTFDADWSPRVRAAIDYASGDRDPTDGDNQRFDTLFGARRFEYGPTGIYGAIARSNIVSPELRLVLKPFANTQWLIAWRGLWLASEQDTWTTSGVADPTGNSGRHVGQQPETRFRWDVYPKRLRLEVGAAYLIREGFQKNAPNGQNTNTAYAYTQMIFRF